MKPTPNSYPYTSMNFQNIDWLIGEVAKLIDTKDPEEPKDSFVARAAALLGTTNDYPYTNMNFQNIDWLIGEIYELIIRMDTTEERITTVEARVEAIREELLAILDNKVDKTNLHSRIYATNVSGNQALCPYDIRNFSRESIPQRDTQGYLYQKELPDSTPSFVDSELVVNVDYARKNFRELMDTKLSVYAVDSDGNQSHLIQSTNNIRYTLSLRDADGNLNVNLTPTQSTSATSKDYVDKEVQIVKNHILANSSILGTRIDETNENVSANTESINQLESELSAFDSKLEGISEWKTLYENEFTENGACYVSFPNDKDIKELSMELYINQNDNTFLTTNQNLYVLFSPETNGLNHTAQLMALSIYPRDDSSVSTLSLTINSTDTLTYINNGDAYIMNGTVPTSWTPNEMIAAKSTIDGNIIDSYLPNQTIAIGPSQSTQTLASLDNVVSQTLPPQSNQNIYKMGATADNPFFVPYWWDKSNIAELTYYSLAGASTTWELDGAISTTEINGSSLVRYDWRVKSNSGNTATLVAFGGNSLTEASYHFIAQLASDYANDLGIRIPAITPQTTTAFGLYSSTDPEPTLWITESGNAYGTQVSTATLKKARYTYTYPKTIGYQRTAIYGENVIPTQALTNKEPMDDFQSQINPKQILDTATTGTTSNYLVIQTPFPNQEVPSGSKIRISYR